MLIVSTYTVVFHHLIRKKDVLFVRELLIARDWSKAS